MRLAMQRAGRHMMRRMDRAAVLEKLLEQLGGDDAGAAAFLQALDRGPGPASPRGRAKAAQAARAGRPAASGI